LGISKKSTKNTKACVSTVIFSCLSVAQEQQLKLTRLFMSRSLRLFYQRRASSFGYSLPLFLLSRPNVDPLLESTKPEKRPKNYTRNTAPHHQQPQERVPPAGCQKGPVNLRTGTVHSYGETVAGKCPPYDPSSLLPDVESVFLNEMPYHGSAYWLVV
jgi:hypothetical protein